jgi:superfamily II DNA or RNA helicase
MSDIFHIEKINEAYIKITCEPSLAYELSDFFTFDVPNAKHMPTYQNRMWDGKIRLYNLLTGALYAGLLSYVKQFCNVRGYSIEYVSDFTITPPSEEQVNEFFKNISQNSEYVPREYQMSIFNHCVSNDRSLILSPTASGKSFSIYLLVRFYGVKTLIVVPTINLVTQLKQDFADYGMDVDSFVHCIYSGEEKNSHKPITISTWQSIYKLNIKFFEKIELFVGDEAHLFKAKSLIGIMSKLPNCKYRFGFSGTLDGTMTNKLVLEGLFGPVYNAIDTKTLIEQGHLADLSIKAIVLSYPEDIRKIVSKMDYQTEMDYLINLKERNKFIINLTLSLKGNTLLLFQYVDKHGKKLYNILKEICPNRKIFFVSGAVKGQIREDIRRIVEESDDAIIVASYGTFSTGVNIKNLNNVIFASPSKSRIRNLQSIGRVLRKSKTKNTAELFDIADDFIYRSKKNITIIHFMERVKIYNEEQFNYRIIKVPITIQ